ncbi:alpha/beta fold hydrolase [Candidatus Microgenomates bacterium]|nr:alpha/beta fold hydrolase [Candidatus Microgenomates bacterium]
MEVTALVPCYNEEQTIKNILEVLIDSPLITKVVVIDDGSTDQSLKIIKRYQGKKLETVFLTKNRGKGEAVKEGLKKVKTKAVFLCDADLQGLKNFHIKLLVKTFQKRKQQVVVGLTEKKLSKITHPLRENLLLLISGQRIYLLSHLKKITKNPLSSQWGLEIYANYYCRKNKIKITKLLLKGVNDSPKWKKGHGIKPALKEAFDIPLRYFLIYCLYNPYQIFSSQLHSKKRRRGKFKIRKIKINKKTINFAQIGKGEPLLLIHGWANNWEGWIPLVPTLKKKYTLYLIDLLGFGDSSPLKNYSIENQTKYVSLFLEKLKIYPKAIIGVSMGSLIAGAIGKNYPQRTQSIILIGAPFKTKSLTLAAKAFEKSLAMINGRKKAETALKKIVETRVTAYLLAKYINMHKFNKFLIDAYGMIGKKKMTKEAFVQMGLSGARLRLEKVLDNCQLPVFFIYGAQDKIIPLKQAKKILEGKKGNFSFASVPLAGHVVPWEKPKKVASLIKKFLKDI